jgi:TonB-dependent receptor
VESVLTRDGIGQFPDQNVAEAVRRAPGVNVLNDQGEGRFVAIRGLSPDLNAASVNGVRLTAPESDVRSVALDVIPSDIIESIEIQKTLTPDMDADSLGGSINIVTTKGFDRREPLLSVRAEGSYNDLNGDWSPRASVDFSNAWGNLGVAGGLSYTNRSFSTDNVEMDGWDEDGGVVYADTFEYRDYDVERTRIGGSLSFDYRTRHDHTSLFARLLHSDLRGPGISRPPDLRNGRSACSGRLDSATFLSDDGQIRVERDMKDRFESPDDFVTLARWCDQSGRLALPLRRFLVVR